VSLQGLQMHFFLLLALYRRQKSGIPNSFCVLCVAHIHVQIMHVYVSHVTALVGHADANRHAALLNARKLSVYSTCRLRLQTQTISLLVVVHS
jgi:hypothetical protein